MFGLCSCSNEPDTSDLYTFTGETINDFLLDNDSTRSSFNYVLKRIHYDRLLSSYGQYTCFAPSNEGMQTFIDSLYNDTEAKIPHNGMTECSLVGLTDSLCLELAKYHISNSLYNIIKLSGDGTIVNTMLGRPFTARVNASGQVVLNYSSLITSKDNKMTNGIVHLVSNVIHNSSRLIAEELERDSTFSIFVEALKKTHLIDSLTATSKGITYEMEDCTDHGSTSTLYYPKECKIGYTIFAEPNGIFGKVGIYSFSDLKQKCIEWYGNATDWYDYPAEKGIQISIGDDYENRFNVVNMFVAYHILKASMAVDQIVYDFSKRSSNVHWNYAFGAEPQDYFETMLPNTLMKIWEPLYHNSGSSLNLWINRYRANNTLTNQVGLQGSESMHQLIRKGVLIRRDLPSIQSYNGYIHKIDDILLYDKTVARGVLNERLRLDLSTFCVELINNGFRGALQEEISSMNGGGSGERVAFPNDYFDNITCYNQNTCIRFNIQGAWRAHESDQFQGWNQYDFAVRIPPVPTGVYELRTIYPRMESGGLMQYYIGTSRKSQSMMAVGLPLDGRLPHMGEEEATAMGYVDVAETSDYGVETDVMLRNHSYMRAPCSFSRGTNNTIIGPATSAAEITGSTSCRTETGFGTCMIRRIVTRMMFKQSGEYWFRIKNLITDDKNLGWKLDYFELVPLSIVDNQTYSEDWY